MRVVYFKRLRELGLHADDDDGGRQYFAHFKRQTQRCCTFTYNVQEQARSPHQDHFRTTSRRFRLQLHLECWSDESQTLRNDDGC